MNKFIVLFVVSIVLLGAMTFLMWQSFQGQSFYAVYLRTGDIYFGKLSHLPFGLRQVYTLQVNAQNPQTPINIQRFINVFWGPEDFLRLNREEVVWITKLNPEGQLAQLIRANPNLVPPQAPQENSPVSNP